MTIRLCRDLLREGSDHRALRTQVDRGDLVRVRHGAYDEPATVPRNAVERHRQLLDATAPRLGPETVISHASAAVLHGLVVPDRVLPLVTATRPRGKGGGGHVSAHLRTWTASLSSKDVIVLDGLSVTSLPRTLVDLARTLNFEEAVIMLDAALRTGCRPATQNHELRLELEALLAATRGARGVGRARSALLFSDGRAESPLETRSRILMARQGVPAPDLQYELFDDQGHLLARSDFAWVAQKVFGEADGRTKYEDLLRPGQTVADVVMYEKRREEMAKALGWRGIRWGDEDLARPRVLARRVATALGEDPP